MAAGWYRNPHRGLPSSVGLMLIFCQLTGVPKALLQDGGYLTDLRTALAACVTARALAPAGTRAIGFVGAGTICRHLIDTLPSVLPQCRTLRIWARRPEAAVSLAEMANAGGEVAPAGWWSAETSPSLGQLASECDVIFTCTPSRQPLLLSCHVDGRGPDCPGLHICALGADQKGKQELDPSLLGKADLLVADSREQCFAFGELSHGLAHGHVKEDDPRLVDLGALLSSQVERQRDTSAQGGAADRRLTIADSTGVGASDLCIAEAAYGALHPGALPKRLPFAHAWRFGDVQPASPHSRM